MKDLLNFIITSLVTKPDAVSIDEQNEEGNINLNLTVDPSDMGLVIGKNGQTIRAIRRLLTVRAIAENVRVNLQLIEQPGQSGVENPAEDLAPTEPAGETNQEQESDKETTP